MQFFSFNVAQVPVIPHEVLLHSIFQEEMKEMADNPTVLKHLKQQVGLGVLPFYQHNITCNRVFHTLRALVGIIMNSL